MDITRIPSTITPNLGGVTGTGTSLGTGAASASGTFVGGFGDALGDAISTLNQLQQEADGKTMALAAGEPVELHDVMIAQDRASLGFQLAVQVRNKLVEAYQDVMRMQL